MKQRLRSELLSVRKVLRYARLYGPGRTLVKVRGRRHMSAHRRPRVRFRTGSDAGTHVGLIGCGNFGYTTVAYFLGKNYGRVLRGVVDIEPNRAASLARRYRVPYFTDDAERVIRDPAIDLIFIASNHASHADYAIRALRAGKSVHVEKPHVVDEEQLIALCKEMLVSPGRLRIGFNRPDSQLGQEVQRHLAAHEGPAMIDWFVLGHELPPGHWYLDEREGGRVLGNLCHWTDFVLRSVPEEGRYPIKIRPTSAGRSDVDISVSYTFGDGSIAVISFCEAKGHAFEGVRERLSLHRGELLLSLTDFEHLIAEVGARRERSSPRWRDHGHERAVMSSYEMVRPREDCGATDASLAYVWETGLLFLRTRQALEDGQSITLHAMPPPGWP